MCESPFKLRPSVCHALGADFARLPLAVNDRAAVLETAGVLADHLPVERVVLYGSKARGDDRPDNDIDLLILTVRPRAEVHAAGRQRRRRAFPI